MDGPGTIAWEEFLENAESLVELSNELSDNWELHGNKEEPGQAYLVRNVTINIPIERGSNEDNSNNAKSLLFDNLLDDPFEVNINDRPLIIEHHILWSLSYGVPVLYFNAWKSNFKGENAISVEEAQNYLTDSDLKYTELSQAFHPILNTPFLLLHPCLTRDLLKNTPDSKNQIVSWLSTVAPAAYHLKLHPNYYKLTI